MPPPDAGMPPPPAMCAADADCAGKCPPGVTDCVCAPTPMGDRCVPGCQTNQDCPMGPMGPLVCTPQHFCAPPM
jgi:hypothetical protein